MSNGIGKKEAAQRLIDTAIEMYFYGKDTLAVFSLSYSGFKVLYDLYKHRQPGDFADQINKALGDHGWRHMSGTANFLKHADKDHDEMLRNHHPFQCTVILSLAVIMYRQTFADLTVGMMAFDLWTDELMFDVLGIEELDNNPERVEAARRERIRIQGLPFDQQIVVGRARYEFFMKNYDPLSKMIERKKAEGKSLNEILDEASGFK